MRRVFLQTERLGICNRCQGKDGCFADCSSLDVASPHYNVMTQCEWTIVEGADLLDLCLRGGVTPKQVRELNGQVNDDYFKPGAKVLLPYGICCVLARTFGENTRIGASFRRR